MSAFSCPSFKPRVLVVGADASLHRSIHGVLGRDYDVHHAYFPRLARRLISHHEVDLLLVLLEGTQDDWATDIARATRALPVGERIDVFGISLQAATEPETARFEDAPAAEGLDGVFAWPRQAEALRTTAARLLGPSTAHEPLQVTLSPFFGPALMLS